MSFDTTAAKIFSDFKGINNLRYSDKNDDGNTLKEVAKQFEAYMIQMVFKSMREANQAFKSDLMSSDEMDFYEGMFDQQLALSLSGHFGFAELITRQLSGQDQDLGHMEVQLKQLIETPVVKKAVETIQQFSNPKEFMESLWKVASESAEKLHINPKVLLAQAALETGWGQYIIHHQDGRNTFNLFNIKAHSGWDKEKVMVDTLEFKDGVLQKQKDEFRSYQSYSESFMDYVDFLQSNPRYQHLMETPLNEQAFITGLQEAGFATDPHYAEKILSIMKNNVMGEG